MIVDCLDNWNSYPFGAAWKQAFDFLASLTADAEEKEYQLQGEEVFARVMSYETRAPDASMFEAHRRYVDIQCVIAGSERMEAVPATGLETKTPYDASSDVELYNPTQPSLACAHLRPGIFASLFPHDAHMPGLMDGDAPASVKKVVVKIDAALLTT